MKKGIWLGLFLLFVLPLRADTVKIKKTGEVLYGKIVYLTKTHLWLDVGNGRLVFKRKDVDFEYNDKMPKNIKPSISIIEVPSTGSSQPSSGKETQEKPSSVPSPQRTTATKEQQKKKENVPSEDMEKIRAVLRDLGRASSLRRRRALFQGRVLIQKYPYTIAEEIRKRLNPKDYPWLISSYMKLLQALPKKIDDMKLVEILLMKFLKHEDKNVRYFTAMALQKITGENIGYPYPQEGSDNSVTPEEERAIDEWMKWWNIQVTKRMQQQLSQRKTETSKEAKELLEKLKKLLGEK